MGKVHKHIHYTRIIIIITVFLKCLLPKLLKLLKFLEFEREKMGPKNYYLDNAHLNWGLFYGVLPFLKDEILIFMIIVSVDVT